MSAHTPGPWQTNEHHYHYVLASDQLAEKMGFHEDDGFKLAEVYTPPIPAMLTGADELPGYDHRAAMDAVDAESKANTRLMAASPDLLEALKAVSVMPWGLLMPARGYTQAWETWVVDRTKITAGTVGL